MKQSICLFMVAILALSLAACGSTGAPALAQTTPATTPPAPATSTPATPSAAPAATPSPIPSPDPTPAPTPTPAPATPKPTATFAPATALADKLMKEKKWTAYKYADTVREAVAIVLGNSTVYTPEQLAAKLRKNVNKIVIAGTITTWGYDLSRKAVSLDTASGTVEALTYVLTDAISGFAEYRKYPWGKIKGVPWCFSSGKSFKLGTRESSFQLMVGLTNFISSRNTPGTVIAEDGCPFNGTMAWVQYYNDGNRSCPSSQQGLSVLFYYAAGSREAEKAFFGDKKESEAYRAAFAKRFGTKKLDSLITMVDAIGCYFGYTHEFSSAQQKDGLKRIKDYEDALLGLLETRLAGVKTQAELDQFISDLEQFEKLNLRIEDESYMNSISARIGKIKEAAVTKTIS